MPTYIHRCSSDSCQYEWEDIYSIVADPPTICPKCNQETAQRMIALSGKGVVELTGQELVDSVKASAKVLEREAGKSEKIYSNVLGESRYQQMQQRIDKQKRR